jgi:hypothetical protein
MDPATYSEFWLGIDICTERNKKILFHHWSMIKDVSNKTSHVFFIFWTILTFCMKRKLVSTKPFFIRCGTYDVVAYVIQSLVMASLGLEELEKLGKLN